MAGVGSVSMTVCWQQPLNVSGGCLTVWWPWDRSCFSVSRSQLWCTCTDLAFWMIAGWTGSGSGGWCPWWSLWPSCNNGWCRCPGGQVVCSRWCVVQTSLHSGEPYDYGRSSCRTRRWYSRQDALDCASVKVECFWWQFEFLQPPEVEEALLCRLHHAVCVVGPFQFVRDIRRGTFYPLHYCGVTTMLLIHPQFSYHIHSTLF